MPIPNVSSRQYTGITSSQLLFSNPSTHRRDFVRENKELVRVKSRQKQQASLRNDLPLTIYSSVLDSQTNIKNNFQKGSSRQIVGDERRNALPANGKSTGPNSRQKLRGESQTKSEIKLRSPKKHPKCMTNQKQHTQTHINVKSKLVPDTKHTQSIAVQTDEICDEVYLYSALKKCASPEFKTALKAKYLQKEDLKNESNHLYEQLLANARLIPPNEGLNIRPAPKSFEKPFNTRKSTEQNISSDKETCNPALFPPKFKIRASDHYFETDEVTRPGHGDVNDQFNVMSLPTEMKQRCEAEICDNCPQGYHLLTEKEREQVKKILLEREKLLIKQLNSFPLAIETLRVRQTKQRIERELSALEDSLHKLTKRKVYTKLNG